MADRSAIDDPRASMSMSMSIVLPGSAASWPVHQAPPRSSRGSPPTQSRSAPALHRSRGCRSRPCGRDRPRNGLGASPLQIGWAAPAADEMLTVVREQLSHNEMGAFMLAGWGTSRDLKEAINQGAGVVRIGAHCTESDTTDRHRPSLERV